MRADVLDHGEAITNLPILDREAGLGGVDVGRQHVDVARMAIEHGGRDFVVVARLIVEQRRQILQRVVRLQVGRLVRDHGIGGAVRLREPVTREVRHQVEDLRGLRLTHPAVGRTLDELGAHLRHLFFLLFAHRAAEHVCLTEAEPGKLTGNVHDLLLVDDDAVRLLEDWLELRQQVDDLLLAVLALYVLVDQATLQRSGAKERVRGGDVIEGSRPHILQKAAQAGRLELEDAVGIAGLQQPERCRVVPGDRGEVQFQATGQLQVLQGVFDDREVTQPEEVHFQ